MDALETKSVVRRLQLGECPHCLNKLSYMTNVLQVGTCEKNGMTETIDTYMENGVVFCNVCGYTSDAIQLGLKIVPEDRIIEFDTNWDKKYLEDNTLVYGEKGKNPFNIKDKE